MKVLIAAVAGALVSGSAAYVAGTRAAASSTEIAPVTAIGPATVERVAPAAIPVRHVAAVERARIVDAAPAPVRTGRASETAAPKRSWKKTALIIGGSAASGAAVGGIASGKKGAAIGAAIGGGAASVYEVLQRR